MFQWLCSLFLFYNGFMNKKPGTGQGAGQSSCAPSVKETPVSQWWDWEYANNTHKIHYEKYPSKTDNTNPSIVLIHGFGASTFHWRDNIPVLSETHTVYAIDLLGFGASDKPLIDYTPEVWKRQTVDFVKKVDDNENKVVLVGNSIGGYISVSAAAETDCQDRIHVVVLLNPVAIFRGKELPFSSSWLSWIFQPAIFRWMFHYFQNHIKTTLTSLYPHFPERVDEALIRSILEPSEHPHAREVFGRILSSQLTGKHTYMEDLLSLIKVPIYLIVGKDDPWLMPNIYPDFLKHCPTVFGKKVEAGHCPQDEIPDYVNYLITSFLTLYGNP